MLKISEFSRLARVPAKTLRYYDEIGLFQPSQIDPQSNYRYYAVEQLTALNRIMALKALGLSLEQIMMLTKENVSTEQLRGMLRLKQLEVNQHIFEEQQRLQLIDATLQQLATETSESTSIEVVVKRIDAQQVVSIRELVPHLNAVGEVSTRLFNKLFAELATHRIAPAGAAMALYFDLEFDEHNLDLEICVPIDPAVSVQFDNVLIRKTLPTVEMMACALHVGDYRDLGTTHVALLRWLSNTDYEIDVPNREVFLQHSPDPTTNITEIQYPLKMPNNG